MAQGATQLRVTVDVFSGLPNPTFALTDSEAKEFERRLRLLLPVAPQNVPEPPGLGYRGLVVEGADWPMIDVPIVIYRGVVRHGEMFLPDPGRALERWLLGIAGPRLAPAVRDIVLGDLDSP